MSVVYDKLPILWFHDESDSKWALDVESIIGKYFIPGTIKIYNDLLKLYHDINELKDNDQITLIASGRLCRQLVSLVIDFVQIEHIFIVEYESLASIATIKEERMRRRCPPSSDFMNKNLCVAPSMHSIYGENIIIIEWLSKKSTFDYRYRLTSLVSIGSILFILNEITASTLWFITLAPLIEQIHNDYLIKSIRSSSITLYIRLFKEALIIHPIESKLSLVGYRSLSRLHALRCEDYLLIQTYTKLLTGFLKKENINNIYCRIDLAAKFSERTQSVYKSLALHLYDYTMKIVQFAEISSEKVDYKTNGCVFASIAMIFFEKKMFGMANHYLNQALDQYRKYDPQYLPSDVYMFRSMIQLMLWEVTRSKKHLHASLNDLREIEKNEDLINDDIVKKKLLMNMSIIYMELARYPMALDCLNRALLQSDNDQCGMIDIYRGRGHMFIKLNQFDSALDSYTKALQLCSSLNKQEQAIINIALAITYEHKQEWDAALEHLTQALTIYEQNNNDKFVLGNYSGTEIAHRHLSLIYEQIKNTELACIHKEQAIIEKERLSRLGIRINWRDDLYGFNISVSLSQVTLSDTYTIPDEILI